MNTSQLLENIANLQPDNPDKISTILALDFNTSAGAVLTNNHIFDTTIPIEFNTILTSSFNLFDSNTIFDSYSSNYTSFLSSSFSTSQTTNLLNSQKNVISNLFTSLKTEAGSISSYITAQNEIIKIPFNNNTINTLISCSLGITGTTLSIDDLETLTSGRVQFAKDVVNWLNSKLSSNNLFYYYNVNEIKLNHSDDDGYDSTYAQLKTENQYNFYDQNYEQQSVLADEKLLPGILHQTMLYMERAGTGRISGSSFYSPEYPSHFALKQLYGNNIEFVSNNLSVPTINYTYNPNIDGTAGDFQSSLYSNWNYSNFSIGSYEHPNGYMPINEERTKLNNLNIHIDLTNRGSGDLYTNIINNYLIDQPPFYSKVSFGIPKQTTNLLNYTYDFTTFDKLVNNETVLKTIYAATMNNLYVDGQVIDESKLLLNSEYNTSLINVNLLKFFRNNYNTSGEEILDCSDTSLEKKQKLKIGKDTGEIDEVFSSLGENWALVSYYNTLNDDEEPLATFLNLDSTGSSDVNYNKHITASNRSAYLNAYKNFLASQDYLKVPTYLFTKIAKYEVTSDGTETLIQNFYFDLRNFVVNNPTDDITYTFYDNQIHSNKRYKYVTSQIVVVPALAYGYTSADVVTQGSEQMYLHMGISYIPIYKMIEVPLTTQSDIVVLERPPVTPRVVFYPVLDKNNQVLIEINPSGFDKTEAPISIEDGDVALFDKALESQNNTELLSFSKNFDESGITNYEIFRITNYPSSYSSFSNDKIANIKATNSSKLYTDIIQPNINYYYCVRSKNFRGLPSNPTNIYKIKLVEDGEFYTLEQEIIEDLQKEDIYVRSAVKNLKRFMYISPSITQTTLSESPEGNATDIITEFPLGTTSASVWGKKFKIRVKSKSSGKTIDFNITFNKNNKGEFIPE